MSPLAYGLRDHVIFKQPFPIDRSKMESRPTPSAWADRLPDTEVLVLPIVRDASARSQAGWCTYDTNIKGSPEVEIMCGGVNTKIPEAAGIWRQGNLLHFGFQQDPSQLNENGQRMLLNSIAYISRFTEDRPIVSNPSGFVHDKFMRPTLYLERVLAKPAATSEQVATFFAQPWKKKLSAADNAREWVKERLHYLCWDVEGNGFTVDVDAEALGIAIDGDAIFEKAKSVDDERLLGVLRRRFPQGPKGGDIAKFREWLDLNRHYLFFHQESGYVWLIDPLAKKRGVPTAELRGPDRADRR